MDKADRLKADRRMLTVVGIVGMARIVGQSDPQPSNNPSSVRTFG